MHSIDADPQPDDIDVVLADLGDEYAAAKAKIAAGEAEALRVLAQASVVARERIDKLPRASSRESELPVRAIAAELAVRANESDRTVQRRMEEAHTVATKFAATLDALTEGRVAVAHVRVIVDHGSKIEDPSAREVFEVEAIARAETTTAGRLNASLARLVEEVQPRTFADRHKAAREGRGVWVRDDADGMAELVLRGPAVPVHGMHDMLTQMARKITNAASAAAADGAEPDPRTMSQIRADVLAEIVLTHRVDPATGEGLSDGYGGLASIRAVVNVTVPALALAGVTADPAELVGRAPVDIDTARILALSAPGWERVLADPITGGVLAVDRYTRSADLTRYLRVRDPHCRFPGCRMPAHRCDVDHGRDYALGGETSHCNLACFCRRHHVLKGETPWMVRHLPGGVLEWTSPGGKVYIDIPPPVLVGFVPDLEPPPF
ncbi:MAG: DUF222 domain-containing protein [Microbacterium sp.]|uniref:HNH endonuclease signature motif containing protein n=1 Tax=Microbacterium sp. TaxID=51671 RepID=UPI0027197D1B|nr:HNH endonuclease signature motif containing protein [Microbacterium sp.]MDO8383205.1 DUF222 domain-containing protein [Microbacterium sp.]